MHLLKNLRKFADDGDARYTNEVIRRSLTNLERGFGVSRFADRNDLPTNLWKSIDHKLAKLPDILDGSANSKHREDVINRAIQYGGIGVGAAAGAYFDRRSRLRGLLIGGLIGGVAANAGKSLYDLINC